jgi:hypothetical protein
MTAIHVLTLALALWVVVAGLALANGGVERPQEVVGGGASESAAAGGVSVRATLGQAVVGVVSGSGGEVTAGQGFWHGVAAEYRIHLPLVMRNES